MIRYGGFLYNYDGTDIVEDPDCLDYDPDAEVDSLDYDADDEEDL